MLKINSKVGIINRNIEYIYSQILNFGNLLNKLPEEYRNKIYFENDTIIINDETIGTLKVKILEKKTNDTIKFGTDEDSKINFFLWIQLKPLEPYKTKFRLVLHIDVPLLLRPFIKGKIEDGINEIVDKISALL
ncbi:MAG: hypothetical protein N3A01_02635 [Bacteroidales bacterium]|nr:hypothetical protein [Bacteroidales bacterium]